mmetsp:Transcript_2757/g.8489  ORF Transcript_2757/g.8489 Transcript_2757/m.8489 type:complete len:303 (+) Transcript_2757:225-1133(+)
MHAHKLGHSNAIVLAMDRELANEMLTRKIPVFDNSINLDAWNSTCLQRHIQAVRMERHLAAAALVSFGYDVLLTDSTAVLLKPILPFFRQQPADVDLFFQRDDWPADPVRHIGCAVNAGFVLMRGKKGQKVAALVEDMVKRGLIEFYLRWNNIVDQYGWSFILAESAGMRLEATERGNNTAIGIITRKGCNQDGDCLKAALLPFDLFPRHASSWWSVKSTALIHHLTWNCAEEKAPCGRPENGIRVFRGNRQRLDRYDETDFEDQTAALRAVGAWLVDENPAYVWPFKDRGHVQPPRSVSHF